MKLNDLYHSEACICESCLRLDIFTCETSWAAEYFIELDEPAINALRNCGIDVSKLEEAKTGNVIDD